jgi:hypothetical protein
MNKTIIIAFAFLMVAAGALIIWFLGKNNTTALTDSDAQREAELAAQQLSYNAQLAQQNAQYKQVAAQQSYNACAKNCNANCSVLGDVFGLCPKKRQCLINCQRQFDINAGIISTGGAKGKVVQR